MATKIFTAKSAKFSAKIFNYCNLITIILPVLIPIWFGASIFVYAMNRHSPNLRVGYYTQRAAYVYYGVIGLIIPVATFFPAKLNYYLVLWAVLAAIIIPVSVYFLIKISKEAWTDTEYEA